MQTSLGVLVTKLRNVNVLFQQVWIILLFFAVFSPLLIRRLWSGSFCWNRGWNIEIFSEFLEKIKPIQFIQFVTFYFALSLNKLIATSGFSSCYRFYFLVTDFRTKLKGPRYFIEPLDLYLDLPLSAEMNGNRINKMS